jgi:hypothetical protein
MPGPPPKPSKQRRRRNKAPAVVKLRPDSRELKPPALPSGFSPSAHAWWETIWSSPMAAVYLEADVPALVRLAGLVDRVDSGEATSRVLSEIRALEDRFGLSPLARRRLQWELEQVESEKPVRADQKGRWLRAVSD